MSTKQLDQIKKLNDEYHHFNQLTNLQTQTNGRLKDYVISIKDCICVKGVASQAGSKILAGYKPLFNATVVEKLLEEGATIIGKTAQDAFGFGSFSTNVGVGMEVPLNPVDKNRSCGGSSGGSAGFTRVARQHNIKHIGIAESTGGSIAAPAAFCGVYGLTPTYGLVSRYGLMDYGNSLDKIGPMSLSVSDLALALEIIAGFDEKDATSVDKKIPNYTKTFVKPVKGFKIGVIKECFADGVDDEVKKSVLCAIEKLKQKKGVVVEEVSLSTTAQYALETYYILAMCEASTNLARYCGLRYGIEDEVKGNFTEYFSKVRSENLNKEEKRRIIVGTFARMSGFRDAYYMKAAQVRTCVIEEYKRVFEEYDLLVCPTMPMVAPTFDEIKSLTPLQHYLSDLMTVGPNLAGLPHVSCPTGENKDGMPIGTMFIANHFDEEKLLQVAHALEELFHKESTDAC